jgi:DNA polymerase-1
MATYIIDALNLAYRSHHAQAELRTSNGDPSGMFFGFIRNILSQKKKFRNFRFVVVWDNRAALKFEIQPDYKKGRSRLPSSIYKQVDDLKLFLEFAGVDQYEKEGEEADDVIATLSETLKKDGLVYILTNDKDMLQLVENGKVIVIKPKIGLKEEVYYDEEAVKQKFGVPPKLVPIYLSLAGDSSDNITGVPYLPTKIISDLVVRFGSVENIYDSIDEYTLTVNRKAAILSSRDRIRNNYKLTLLRRDLGDLKYKASVPDRGRVEDLLGRYEIKSLKADDIVEALSTTASNIRFLDPKPTKKLETYSLFD